MVPTSIQLHDYQNQAVDFILNHPYCGVFFDMGLGKTLITLQAVVRRNPHGHVLVVAPKNIARNTWIDEIEKFGLPIRYKSLIVNEKFKDLSKKKRLQLYDEAYHAKPTMYFINRELLTDLIDNMPVENGRPVWYFPNVILDESQSFKSHRAERFLAMKRVRPACSSIIELSGTPTPQGLMDLWSQTYLLDGGARLGQTITWYRKTFFRESMYMNGYPVKWEPLPGAEEEIYRRVSDLVISAKNTNLKLPPVTYHDFTCYMDDKEMAQYKAMARDKVLEVLDGNEKTPVTAKNAGVLHIRLAQLASGTIYLDSDKRYQVVHRRKLEALDAIMSRSSGPVLIAYFYQSDKQEILAHLPNAVLFDGSREMQQQWNDGQIPVMLLHPGSSGHGINIQYGGHTLIWYSIQANLEQYLQTNARLNRQGQSHPTIIHHIICEGTVDSKTLASLHTKDRTENRFLDAVRMPGQSGAWNDDGDSGDVPATTDVLVREMQSVVDDLFS